MPVLYKTYKNTNTASKTYGLYYARLVPTKTMSYDELCKHMSEHNSVYGEDVCKGVALKLASCMLEQLLEGKKVQFSDLGTFYLSAKTSGAATEDDFNVGQNIRGLYLRFSASRQDANDLSAKSLKKLATFLNAKDLIEPKKKNENQNGDDEPMEP